MPDSSPNSPNELFRNLPPEQALDSLLGTQLQLIKLMQKNACNYRYYGIVEVVAGELKSLLPCFRVIVERFQEFSQHLKRITNR